jgi:hypothetical protein
MVKLTEVIAITGITLNALMQLIDLDDGIYE